MTRKHLTAYGKWGKAGNLADLPLCSTLVTVVALHGRCFRFREREERGRERAASQPGSLAYVLPPFFPPLDKLVFWNDRRLFWAWQTIGRERE